MIDYNDCHPWEQWFCRIFDKKWTPSGCPYYFQLNYDSERNPTNLQCFYKEGDGGTSYVGTYRILKMEEVNGNNYVVIQRIGNETLEHIRPMDKEKLLDDIGDVVVARYYPTGWGRLELMPPEGDIAERLLSDVNGRPMSKRMKTTKEIQRPIQKTKPKLVNKNFMAEWKTPERYYLMGMWGFILALTVVPVLFIIIGMLTGVISYE